MNKIKKLSLCGRSCRLVGQNVVNVGRWNVADVNPNLIFAVFILLESYLTTNICIWTTSWDNQKKKTFGILLNLTHLYLPPTLKQRTLQHRNRQIFPLTIAPLSNAHTNVFGKSLDLWLPYICDYKSSWSLSHRGTCNLEQTDSVFWGRSHSHLALSTVTFTLLELRTIF